MAVRLPAALTVLVLLCICKVHALDDLYESNPNDIPVDTLTDLAQDYEDQPMDDVRGVIQSTAIQVRDRKCSCSAGAVCQCCVEAKLRHFFHLKACAGFSYNPSAKALDFTITINNKVIFKKTISVTAPVKFCHAFVIYDQKAKLCVDLRDISFQKGHVGACIYMEIDVKIFYWKQKLGCLYKSMEPKKIGSDDGQDRRAIDSY